MNKLVGTCLEAQFHVFDLRTYHQTKGYASKKVKCGKSTMWQVKHLPQNRDLCMISMGGGNLGLYKYTYPEQRSVKDSDGMDVGVVGTCEMLNERTLSTQPICSFDWHRDKAGLCCFAAFDQAIRVGIVTQLNKY